MQQQIKNPAGGPGFKGGVEMIQKPQANLEAFSQNCQENSSLDKEVLSKSLAALSRVPSDLIEAALHYAAHGLPVFPTSIKKEPLTAHGYKDATTDPAKIRAMFRNPRAAGVATPTGTITGLVVVDRDRKNGVDGVATCEALETDLGKLPPTLQQRTGSGGDQLLFLYPEGVTIKNSQGGQSKGLGKGIDVRAMGGLIVLPPSKNEAGTYVWQNNLDPAPLPQKWVDRMKERPRPEVERKPAPGIVALESSAYGRKALETECQAVASEPQGSRNARTNQAAFAVGQLVAGGEIQEEEGRLALEQAAAACGLDESEADKTIESGLTAGMQEPRQAPGESDWNRDAGQTAGKSNNSYNSYNSSDELENWTPTEKEWPTLHHAAMPGIIRDFVDVATENSEADPAAVLATFLVRLGVEAGSPDVACRPHVYVGETRHEPRLFAIVTGKSSKARKGTSAQPVQRLFTVKGTMGAPSMGGISFGPLSTGEGIIYAVRDAIQEWKEKEQIFVVTDPGITDKRLYVQEEELAAALSASKREGNTLSATLRALWDSGTRSPMTKTSKTRCTEAHVGILAHITLDELALTLSDCDKLNGYANRFLWVLARRAKRVSRPTRIPESIFSPIQSTVWQRLNYAHKMGEMTLSGEFWDVFDSEYDRLSADRSGMAGAITARAEAQVVRLSMVYAIAAGTRTVSAEHIQSALAFWNYAQASAEYIFADQTVGGKIDSTIKALIEGAHDGMSLTDIHKATGNNHKAGDLKASIQRLVDAGFVVSSSIRGPEDRKSRTVFFKNTSTNFTNFTNYSETPDSATEIIPDMVTL